MLLKAAVALQECLLFLLCGDRWIGGLGWSYGAVVGIYLRESWLWGGVGLVVAGLVAFWFWRGERCRHCKQRWAYQKTGAVSEQKGSFWAGKRYALYVEYACKYCGERVWRDETPKGD